ncbi:histidine kinase [Rhodomicrobium vannielii ATCC 17100]|uniref:histidine kinase n=1 Tax=Rhodomicrobium vannielii (strain ATCC 17100 / DSM 162 / LMG 4299 / NCIMB 10020 / ATH 3.1.1) TaxID=648757 RepID=E3I4M5_RHOVT|nr:ATP-binding protein [Rhodomicrobium vannielii]ADP71607.1 histidine kinase [Rhodomicrobium vannielii ATCC 17100]
MLEVYRDSDSKRFSDGIVRRKVIPAASDRRGASSHGSGLLPRHGVLSRLYLRRWLVLLAAAVIGLLSLFHGLPLAAPTAAILTFVAGAAFIPASRARLRYDAVSVDRAKEETLAVAKPIADALPDPAILLARDGTILAFNGKARDLFDGLKNGAHISSATRSPQVLDAVMECGPVNRQQTVTFSERVPVERHMAATVSWLVLPSDAGPSILVYLRDLTEQRRLDQLRADFIANASHEIKTPLASLSGFIQTLHGAARHDEAARDRFLPIMAKQAERMARLIDNLMSLSRVEMRAHLKPQGEVAIAELVEQACEALEPMAAEADVTVAVESEVGDVTVLGDRDELTQVFINLVHNAIKYGGNGGSVQVKLKRQRSGSQDMIAISVEDDGPGILGQHLPRLTERFYRVAGAAGHEKGGTGLGLAIVKHVVNRHRGELRIASEVGSGSKFTVLLAEHKSNLGLLEVAFKPTAQPTLEE